MPPTSAEQAALPGPRGTGVVFVTGAGGFIGYHIAEGFAAAGWRVVRFGYDTSGIGWAGGDRRFVGPIDGAVLARAAALIAAPQVIVHAAGGSSVAASAADPAEDFDRTVGSLREVLEFMRGHAPDARLIYLSSAAVYGAAGASPLSEGSPLEPISAYGLHKRLGEELIRGWADLWDLDATAVRFFSVYGPGNRKQLLWDLATRLGRDPLLLRLAGSGKERRDFLYVDDAVQMIGLIAALDRGAAPIVVNGGSGEPRTVRAAAEDLCRAFAAPARISFSGEVRPGDPASLVADPASARRLGFVPLIDFATGIHRYAAWARQAIAEPPRLEERRETASRRR